MGSKTRKIENKAIDHMNCDPLTVSVGFSAYSFEYQTTSVRNELD